MQKVKFYVLKANVSKVEDKDFEELVKRISEKVKESDAVVMEAEDMFKPWFYILFKSRAKASAFKASFSGKFGEVRLTSAREPVLIPVSQFSQAYVKDMDKIGETEKNIKNNMA